MTRPSGSTAKDSPANSTAFAADPVDQGGVIAVLERADLELGFEDALGPLPHRPGLGHDDELGAGEPEAPHVLGEMPVVADGDADPPGGCGENEFAAVPRGIVAALVESRPLHDMDHPDDAQDAAARVDDGRGVIGPVGIPFEEFKTATTPVSRAKAERSVVGPGMGSASPGLAAVAGVWG
jgi:hypothetical protein